MSLGDIMWIITSHQVPVPDNHDVIDVPDLHDITDADRHFDVICEE